MTRPARVTGQATPLLAALVFLVAINLRPALTSLGPLLPRIGADTGLSEGLQGLLGSVPLLAFAVVSPLVHFLAKRIGMERSILVALLALIAGLLIRSFTGHGGLWFGTLVIGCAIAVGNVLVPALVRRDYPDRIAMATGIYSATMGLGAAFASGLAVPLSGPFGWPGALAFWVFPAVLTLVLWLPRTRRTSVSDTPATASPTTPLVSVWRQPVAWLVTAYMGVQSLTFYVLLTWLPTIGIAAGASEVRAGIYLVIYQTAGLLASLLVPHLMGRGAHQVPAAVAASCLVLIGVLGLLLAPSAMLVWSIIAGAGGGSSLVVSLSLISMRGRTPLETTQLSGMAQSIGYLLAAAGPVAAGILTQYTGNWHAALLVLAILGAWQIVQGVRAGRDRRPQ